MIWPSERGEVQSGVVAGISAISLEQVLRLETVVGGTADHWLCMQAAFDAEQVYANADGSFRVLSLSRCYRRSQGYCREGARIAVLSSAHVKTSF